MVERKLVWPAVLLVCALLILQTFLVVGLVNKNTNLNANKPAVVDLTPVVNAVNSITVESPDADKLDVIYSKLTEDDVTEAKALELTLESVNSKDFKKAVYNALLDAGVTIEDYRDITEVKVLESDVDKDTVTFEVKVYYFVDGDEEETQKARLDNFDVVVDNLDYDEDFEEAEVNEDYLDTLTVKKVYD